MRRTIATLCLVLFLFAPAARAEAPAALKPIGLSDILAWKHIRGTAVSPDGQWFAYLLAPTEGNATLVLRQTRGDKELRFPAGAARGFGGAPEFSEDSRWLAFAVQPNAKETKAALVNLATGKKQGFDHVRRFAFAGETGGWIALHTQPASASAPAETAGPRAPTATRERGSTGTDLILHELATGNQLNIGNVAEFAFDKKGHHLALVIDARDQAGNGVQLRNMITGAVVPLDSGKATYRGLNWTEHGDGLAVLKGVEDKGYKDKLYSVLGFTDFTARTPAKVVYDPRGDKRFPADMTVSPNRTPSWTDDLSGLLFGIHAVKKATPALAGLARLLTGATKAAAEKDKPDLVLWHWSDRRLQSQQQVQAAADKNYSYLCTYRVAEKKFLRLADDKLRQVTPAPHQRWGIGIDTRDYELMGSLNGQRYQDLWVVDLHTGKRRHALKRNWWYFGPSPEGTHFLHYHDGHFYVYELATGQSRNITKDVPASFFNDEDDHNLVKPPRPPLGWVKDSVAVLLSDGWDVWNVTVHGGKGTNLTRDGKRDAVRYGRRFVFDRDEKGIDLSRSMYLTAYGEWTKKAGIARIDPGQPGAKRLCWDDAAYGAVLKAKHADVYLYTRETAKDYPDYYAAGAALAKGRRLTHANPQQEKYRWSKGARLIDYTSAKGKKLQAALWLPADYEAGKHYPTIVYIYEKLSQFYHRHAAPTANGFNPAVYTSQGYAVLMPDIVYAVNDPGRSAVWCVLPALEAAIATGVVDRDRVGLHGHSWGGYQTAFLITQTDAFRAAVAGAPLTNLISMYSSIYWNTGWANQPIFESSQGRFTGGYWEEQDAYIRNSPVFFAKNVKTPLLLLHNDKDGAVDWNQGIEYFNTLRRLRKPVVLLQYKGENHGLRKPANQKDYTVRMREFFDHHLRGRPAPTWLKDGVPHLQMEEHLTERAKMNDG